jgi:hypothetical protein
MCLGQECTDLAHLVCNDVEPNRFAMSIQMKLKPRFSLLRLFYDYSAAKCAKNEM